jgi:hypothetical protein
MPPIVVAYQKKTAEAKASSQARRAMKKEVIKKVTAAPLIPSPPVLRILLRIRKWQAPEFPGSNLSAPASGHKEDSEIINTLFVIPHESGFFCNSKSAFL